jgi:hypothetical protein
VALIDAREAPPKKRGPNLQQVRAAIKNLEQSGDAIRIGRGRYLSRDAAATPPAGGETPDADTSGYSLAAE